MIRHRTFGPTCGELRQTLSQSEPEANLDSMQVLLSTRGRLPDIVLTRKWPAGDGIRVSQMAHGVRSLPDFPLARYHGRQKNEMLSRIAAHAAAPVGISSFQTKPPTPTSHELVGLPLSGIFVDVSSPRRCASPNDSASADDCDLGDPCCENGRRSRGA